MKVLADSAIILGAMVIAVGVLGLNIVLLLIGCVGILAGFGIKNQLGYDKRLARMESQLRSILQTQRQSNQLPTQSFEQPSQPNPDEEIAFHMLQDE